ncbi:BTAD domain-containing putative transcriptional regulator [Saccharothrix mutabilis subsp. mutabilis]|uniref:BTAD domain-containing putative transcriptional regulator n=1 Tax=Saccharothrix mutabilis subsp. mutabilis TaxID=66855 RepID=A0ABP3DWM1_9PSEU
MRYRLLGPVEVWRDGERVPVGGRKQRSLLAVLLLDAGRVVPPARLVRALWGERPPASARAQVHNHVSALRRNVDVRRVAEGYRLDVAGGALDLAEFDAAVTAARAAVAAGDDARAARLLGTCLGLWREPVLGGVTEELREMAVPGLVERRLAALCDRIDAELWLGRHGDLLGELRGLVDEHPLDDRFPSRLVLALHRAGRQADALAAYDEHRRRRRDELGLDPSPALRDLHRAVLAFDPALDLPAPPVAPAVRVTGGTRQRAVLAALEARAGAVVPVERLVAEVWGDDPPATARTMVQVYVSRLRRALSGSGTTITTEPGGYRLDAPPATSPGSAVPVPRQLPAKPRLFVGRTDELGTLTKIVERRADETMSVVVISGPGGIGKTWLAAQWAHQNLHRFPDGQLHVDLRGFDPVGEPVPPGVALRGFLDALGASAAPADPAALYRSLTADRRMVVVIDNARDTEQVLPLLPGGAGCTVLVTSRNRLPGLVAAHGAQPLAVDVLPESDARELLARAFGRERVSAEPDATARVVAHCAGLPLALSVGAARALTQPGLSLAVLAEELRVTGLDALDTDDLPANLRTVFLGSYRALPAEAAALFTLLGLAPGPDISLAAAACLGGQDAGRTAAHLRELEQRSLISRSAPDRHRMHDLLHLYAADLAAALPAATRDAAVRRLIACYLHTARAADLVLAPHRRPLDMPPLPPGCAVGSPADHDAALAWFDAEHANLLSAQRLSAREGLQREAWWFAWVLTTYHRLRGHLQEDLAAWRVGVAAADLVGAATDRAAAHKLLGQACARVGEHAEALDHLRLALELSEEVGDLAGRLRAHHALALAWSRQSDHAQALRHAETTLLLAREARDEGWEAAALNAVGWYSARLGRLDHAQRDCAAAVEMFRRIGDFQGEGSALDSLGFVATAQGDHGGAVSHYGAALAVFQRIGNTYQQANALDHLAEAHEALGDAAAARGAWRRALELYRAQHRVGDVERISRRLG